MPESVFLLVFFEINRNKLSSSKFWKKLLAIFMKSIIVLVGLFILLPNIFNSREREAFSFSLRIEKAKERYSIDEIGDSVVVPASRFYKRGAFHKFFYGQKYRQLWSIPVKVPIFDIDSVEGGLIPLELSGGMQTIGMDLINGEGRKFDLRSVNKDQSNALPKWLRITYLRALFRDQTAAMNPYASLVVPQLAEAVGIPHTSPKLYFVPYDSDMDSIYRFAMAGRMVILEKNLNDSWAGYKNYENVSGFYDTDEMFEKAESSNIGIDTMNYLKNRLFDILINDWDRHEGQWEWALIDENDSLFFRPFPKDRDMAFYDFRGGLVNSLALLFNNKFQSFTKEYGSIKALSKNSRELDKRLLSDLKEKEFVEVANIIRSEIGNGTIHSAFKNYPEKIYLAVGEDHEEIFKVRLDELLVASREFYKVLQ